MTRKLYVAWQDAARKWHTIAQLTRAEGTYEFVFTHGAIPFGNVIHKLFNMELGYQYRFATLIPLFQNRILSGSRPDFVRLSEWVGANATDDEFERLAKFGPIPGTDSMLVYSEPVLENGMFSVDFFVHGIRYMHDDVLVWAENVLTGTRLLPMIDLQNEADPNAVALRACQGNILIGYVPAFYAKPILQILKSSGSSTDAKVNVLRSNRNAPAQIKLFCRFKATLETGFHLEVDEDSIPLTKPTHNVQNERGSAGFSRNSATERKVI